MFTPTFDGYLFVMHGSSHGGGVASAQLGDLTNPTIFDPFLIQVPVFANQSIDFELRDSVTYRWSGAIGSIVANGFFAREFSETPIIDGQLGNLVIEDQNDPLFQQVQLSNKLLTMVNTMRQDPTYGPAAEAFAQVFVPEPTTSALATVGFSILVASQLLRRRSRRKTR